MHTSSTRCLQAHENCADYVTTYAWRWLLQYVCIAVVQRSACSRSSSSSSSLVACAETLNMPSCMPMSEHAHIVIVRGSQHAQDEAVQSTTNAYMYCSASMLTLCAAVSAPAKCQCIASVQQRSDTNALAAVQLVTVYVSLYTLPPNKVALHGSVMLPKRCSVVQAQQSCICVEA
jgi:hypothetical protein